MTYIKSFIQEFWFLYSEMSVYLLFGFLIAGILHVYLKKERISHYLGKKDFRSVLYASLLGIPLPLCSCGVIPAGISFYKNGASKGSTVSFLISTPQTGVDSLMVTYSLLGLPMAIFRAIIAFITGIVGGWFTNKLDHEEIQIVEASCSASSNGTTRSKWKEVFYYGFVKFFQDISKWLLVGLLIAAVVAVILPDNFFGTTIESPYLQMLLVLITAIPVYICATGSVPIAAVLMLKGLSPGAALVFLMAGPATNVATLTVLAKSIGKKATLIYLLTISLGAIFFGIIMNEFLPSSWFIVSGEIGSHTHEVMPLWVQVTASVVMTVLYVYSWGVQFKNKYNEHKIKKAMKDKTTTVLHVEGMMCKNCKAHVEKDLQLVNGVEAVVADVRTGEVTLTGLNIDLSIVKKTITAGGYSIKE